MTEKITIEYTPEELAVVHQALGEYFARGVRGVSTAEGLAAQMPDSVKEKYDKRLEEEWDKIRTADALRVKLDPYIKEIKTAEREKANAVA